MQLGGAGNRHNPRLLRQQPCQRDLGRCRLLPLWRCAEQIDQGLVRLERLRRETGERAAEVGAVERRILVHLTREKPFAQGAVGNEPDPEFLEGRYHFLLGRSRPQRIFALESRERLDGVCAADGFYSCFGKAEVLHLALLNQLLYRARHVFNRHVRIDPVLIEQVDDIDLEPLERAFDGLFDMLRPAVQAGAPFMPRGSKLRIEVEPEFGGDHHLSAERSEGFAHEFFVR